MVSVSRSIDAAIRLVFAIPPMKGDKSTCCQKTTLGVREQPIQQPSMALEAKAARRTVTAVAADDSGPSGASSPAGPWGTEQCCERRGLTGAMIKIMLRYSDELTVRACMYQKTKATRTPYIEKCCTAMAALEKKKKRVVGDGAAAGGQSSYCGSPSSHSIPPQRPI